jgi:hypothetical protein
MAKSKKKVVKDDTVKSVEPSIDDIKITQNKKFEEDLTEMKVPFDLYTGLSMVTAELKSNSFVYDHFTNNGRQDIITFTPIEKGKEIILINIEKENLIVRHFDILEDGRRKARVLYVVKPTERTFKLVKRRV